MHQLKACIKSELKEDGGLVKGYASTFDREPDAYGDVVARGAFTKSLERWNALNEEGKYIPLLWAHDTDDPKSNIGRVVNAIEDGRGLFVTAEFDAENEKAQYVRKLVQEGRVYQFSFAYEVRDQASVEVEGGQKANELRELELFEVSLVQIPANQHATVEEIKSNEPEIKAGRRNSKADEDEIKSALENIKAAESILNGLLAERREESEEMQEGESQSDAEVKSEEPDTVNDEEPKAKEQVDVLLQVATELLKEV